MNQNNPDNQEVTREPLDIAALVCETEREFQFTNGPLNETQLAACNHIEAFGRGMAQEIATVVPEGKERTIAINAVLTAVLWARQGITRRCVEVVATLPVPKDQV